MDRRRIGLQKIATGLLLACAFVLPQFAQEDTAALPDQLNEARQARQELVANIEDLGGRVSATGVITTPESSPEELPSGSAILLRSAQSVLARLDAQIALLESPPNLPTRELFPADEATEGFQRLDVILDGVAAAKDATKAAETELLEAQLNRADAEKRRQLMERKRRRLNDGGSLPSDAPAPRALLEWQARLAREEATLETLRVKRAEQVLAHWRETVEQRQIHADQARRSLQVTPQQLQDLLDQLDAKTLEEEQALSQLEASLERAVQRWVQLTQRAGDDLPPGTERAYRHSLVKSLEYERPIRLGRIEIFDQRRQAWKIRFARFGIGEAPADADEQLDEILGSVDRQSRSETLRLDRLSRRLAQCEAVEAESAAGRNWLDQEKRVWRESISLGEAFKLETRDTRRLAERTIAESDGLTRPFIDMVKNMGSYAAAAWNWELVAVDGNPITLGKICLALLLFAAGYGLAKRLSRTVAFVLMDRFSVSTGAGHALQNLIFYLLALSFFLTGLQWVGIPLTALTLLGGVVAIGVGFGSQNVVNNFISGLILLLERPIKVGDLIDVEGVLGTVQRIGLRSTVIRAGNNTQIFVPNSSFLEKNVLNWTGSDDLVRSEVDIGVAYGSPVETVKRLMLQSLREEPLVISQPPPEVLFVDFGDSSLLFRAFFWHSVRAGLDVDRVQSNLRFRFEKQCAEAGINIAFPQRDLHLDTLSPLQIRLLSSDFDTSCATRTSPEPLKSNERNGEQAPGDPPDLNDSADDLQIP